MKCEGFTSNGNNCAIEAEAPCESCGSQVCNTHGHYHSHDERDEVFLCNDCMDELNRSSEEETNVTDMDDRNI